ncbi:MAG: dockerin type I repeat-containing protein [Ruminococcus sp.]|nr:dockerin type I repeat-containing protein [Ruminococcus sp.]
MIKKFTAFIMGLMVTASASTFTANAETIKTQDFKSAFEIGQHLKAGDDIDVGIDSKKSFGIKTFINGEEYYRSFLSGHYAMPCDMVVVYVTEDYMQLVAESDIADCIDVTTLNTGDIIDTTKFMLLYDYITDTYDRGFLADYDDVGEGTIDVAYIDHENKSIILRASENMGDFDGNGSFNISDVVRFQQWLMGKEDDRYSTKWYNVDLNKDGSADVFDFCIMKKMLAESLCNPHIMTLDELYYFTLNSYEKTLTFDDFAGFEYIRTDSGYEYPIEDTNDVIQIVGDMDSGYIENIYYCNTANGKKVPFDDFCKFIYLYSDEL